MSFSKYLKKGLGFLGDAAKFAAPAMSFIPGVGWVAAAGIGAAGGALGTLNDKKGTSLGRALKHGVGYGAAGALGGAGVDKFQAARAAGSGLAGAMGGGGMSGGMSGGMLEAAPRAAMTGMAEAGRQVGSMGMGGGMGMGAQAAGRGGLGAALKGGASAFGKFASTPGGAFVTSQTLSPLVQAAAGPSELERLQLDTGRYNLDRSKREEEREEEERRKAMGYFGPILGKLRQNLDTPLGGY